MNGFKPGSIGRLARSTGATAVVKDVIKLGGSVIPAATAAAGGGIAAGIGATAGAVVGGIVTIVTSPAVLTFGAIAGGVFLLKKLLD